MKTPKIAGAVIVVLLLLIIIVPSFVDLNGLKPKIEQAALEKADIVLKINGDVKLSLIPKVAIVLNKTEITTGDGLNVVLNKVRIVPKLGSLIRRKPQLETIELIRPEIIIGRDGGKRDADLNTERRSAIKNTPKPLTDAGKHRAARESKIFDRLTVRDGSISVLDEAGAVKVKASGIELEVEDFILAASAHTADASSDAPDYAQAGGGAFSRLGLNASAKVKAVRAGALEIFDLTTRIVGGKGILRMDDIAFVFYGGGGKGSAIIDFSQKPPAGTLKQEIIRIDTAALFEAIKSKQTMDGKLDVSVDLSWIGLSKQKITQSLRGNIELGGDELTLNGFDIDKLLADYRKTKEVGLLDLGAFVLAGPLGTLLTKGYGIGVTAKDLRGGETRIRKLVSLWDISGGRARARDVAVATGANRIAVKGALNLVSETYENVVIAVLDRNGCAELTQTIRGSFSNPRIDKVSAVASTVLAPVISIFKKTKKLVTHSKCKPFYTGSVAHP